ncbi:hypothetical protein ADL22_13060 [Streptomyces sp. NRRL F-4489]|uniref:hypothetical protein n=1 Tax=Streptomyces sp. NRRL F-4489 TaxID=1609095 RepID=UPI000747CB25|nr:hypothetical protein [Streptomyces sp. NRRL F-4489]KUL43813.1 hypothetical protein ADL22_13060 [Streptomyces sp. NRRL F-4489]
MTHRGLATAVAPPQGGNGSLPLAGPGRTTNFDRNFWLADPAYLAQAEELAAVFQQAIDPRSLVFHAGKALELAQGIPNAAVLRAATHTFTRKAAPVPLLVTELKRLLSATLGVRISAGGFWQQATTALFRAFADPHAEENGAWVRVREEERDRTHFLAHLLFAVQNGNTGATLVAMPFDLDVTLHNPRPAMGPVRREIAGRCEITVRTLSLMQALRAHPTRPLLP